MSITPLTNSELIEKLDYTTVQRVIGEDCKFLDLVYKATRDGFRFQDLTRMLNITDQHTKEYKDRRISWVYLIQSDDRTFGFRTVTKNNEVIECYMFSLNLFRRFYAYLDEITVRSHYPSGIDLFDSPRVGRFDDYLMFDANGSSFYDIFRDIVTVDRFNINQIELYVTDKTNLRDTKQTIQYKLDYENSTRFRTINSEILSLDNINQVESLITPLDNLMFHSRLIEGGEDELDDDVDLEHLIEDNNVLILFKTHTYKFALYIPRNNCVCMEDYNKFNRLVLYSLDMDEAIPLDDYDFDIKQSWKGITIKLVLRECGEYLRLIRIKRDKLKPMSGKSYDLDTNFSPSLYLTINEIFDENIDIEQYEDEEGSEYLYFSLKYYAVEIYLVGRDESMHGCKSKRDTRDIIS